MLYSRHVHCIVRRAHTQQVCWYLSFDPADSVGSDAGPLDNAHQTANRDQSVPDAITRRAQIVALRNRLSRLEARRDMRPELRRQSFTVCASNLTADAISADL
jgi:hypothetical protein